MKRKILAINGSTKQNSTNHLILKHIEKKSVSIDFELYERIDSLPHFNPDLDKEIAPAEVMALREKISMADGVLFCTPEYVFSLPGSLKNALEWCVSTTVFSKKPVAMIVAAAHGAKALESLQLILSTIECSFDDASTLLIQGAKGKVNPESIAIDTAEKINRVVDSLLRNIESAENK